MLTVTFIIPAFRNSLNEGLGPEAANGYRTADIRQRPEVFREGCTKTRHPNKINDAALWLAFSGLGLDLLCGWLQRGQYDCGWTWRNIPIVTRIILVHCSINGIGGI